MGIKYAVNENFFDSWSHDMSYILGFWFADGSMEDASKIRAKYIRVSSTDKEVIDFIKNTLCSGHKINIRSKGRNKTSFLLRIGNHELYNSLQSLGVTTRKSLNMIFPEVPKRFISDFVRGYFDGDGCVYYKGKRMRIIFTSGSVDFLNKLEKIIRDNAGTTRQNIHHQKSSRAYRLLYSTNDSDRIFKFMFYKKNLPHLRRKGKIFKQFYLDHERRRSNEIDNILAQW